MTWNSMTLVLAQDNAADRPVSTDGAAPGGTTESQGADGSQTPVGGNNNQPANPFGGNFLFFLIIMMVAVMVLPSLMGRKEKKKRAAMMAAMAKGDKVQTVGGILGTIVEVRDDEIVVKVDENTNSRLRFTRSAIQNIVESKNAE